MFDGQYIAESALAGMSADADQLLTVSWGSLDVDDVLGLADRLEVLRRRLAAVDQAIVADLDRRSAAERFGIRHTAGLLQSRWRISAAEAAGRVQAGRACGRPESSGGPVRPVLAAAAQAGAISVEQSGVVLAALDRIPATTPVAAVSRAEEALVGYAADFDPHRLSVIARRMVERADPELAEADEVAQERRRGLRLWQHRDGSFSIRGRLTGACGSAWQTVLTPLSAPRLDDPSPEAEDRTPVQRMHDGFFAAGMRLLRSGLPASGGLPTTIVLTLSVDQLESRTGLVTSAHGAVLTVRQALQLAVDANVIPVVFDDTGGVLAYGRKRRFADLGQSYAICARDLRCTFPDCDQPAAWCERDHAPAWARGGRTDVDRMHLTCRRHNQPNRRAGWEPILRAGVPYWIPPPWIDPDRRPRRNPQPERDRR